MDMRRHPARRCSTRARRRAIYDSIAPHPERSRRARSGREGAQLMPFAMDPTVKPWEIGAGAEMGGPFQSLHERSLSSSRGAVIRSRLNPHPEERSLDRVAKDRR